MLEHRRSTEHEALRAKTVEVVVEGEIVPARTCGTTGLSQPDQRFERRSNRHPLVLCRNEDTGSVGRELQRWIVRPLDSHVVAHTPFRIDCRRTDTSDDPRRRFPHHHGGAGASDFHLRGG